MNESKYICNFEPFVGCELKTIPHDKEVVCALSKAKNYNMSFEVNLDDIPDLIARGLIIEVKPAVWTDDDMIEFGQQYSYSCNHNKYAHEILSDFKKEKGL